jgi:CheY-like chemotaxis protein
VALKILLADDSMTAQNMGKKILTDAGYDVVAVSNGAAAIKKIASERPDIAILDEYMPGYTGSEVCERVKGAVETSRIPVLLTVGKMEPFDASKANKVRADGVMIKPFEASDLIAAVQSIAQRLLAPNPTPRASSQTASMRQSVTTLEDTLPIAPPPGIHDTTLSVPAPAGNHDSTVRLTAEQLKAVQESSYKEWVTTPEDPAIDVMTGPAAHLKATAESDFDMGAPAMPAEISVEPPMISPVVETPLAFGQQTVEAATEAVFITEPATPVEAERESPPAFWITAEQQASEAPVTEAAPIFSMQPVEAMQAVVDDSPEMVTLETVEAAVAPTSEAPVLETSAPLVPGPVLVEQASEFEPTSGPDVQVTPAPAEGLEITSPAQQWGTADIPEPALVTESGDMSQFVTKFGTDSGETVHVGVVTDLPPEQLAAIQSVGSEEIATVESAEVVDVTPEPMLQAVQLPEPIVAYVPGIDDTQAIAPVGDEPETVTNLVAVPDTPEIADSTVIEAIPEETVRAEAAKAEAEVPVLQSENAPDEAAAEAIETAISEPTEAIAQAEPIEATISEAPQISMHAVETAAVAAVGAAVAGIAHVLQPAAVETSAVVVEEHPSAEALPHEFEHTASFAEPEPSVEKPMEAVMAGAAPADFTATMDTPAEADTSTEVEAVASTAGSPINDSKLADAVARAFEHLKPQIITQIIKELSKQ